VSSAGEQERIARELAEELRKLTVQDVLVNTLMTVSSIGYRKLGMTEESRAERDLEQTQLAIETMQALTPVLEKFLPAELVRDFASAVANLQLAYAGAASQAAAAAQPAASDEAARGGQSQGESPSREAGTDAGEAAAAGEADPAEPPTAGEQSPGSSADGEQPGA
jgi:hypothetical protein